jgi:DNA-binding MarR family transcriptional regulator
MVKKRLKDDKDILESYRLFHLLRQTSDSIYKIREIELKPYNISPEQAGALVCIQTLGHQATPAELSRWLFRKRNSVTILLNRMQKLGLIEKKVNKNRKNSITLSLTKKGYDAYRSAIEFRAYYPIIDVLPEIKRKQLWSLLQMIRLKIFKDLGLDAEIHSGFLDKPIVIDSDNSDSETEVA